LSFYFVLKSKKTEIVLFVNFKNLDMENNGVIFLHLKNCKRDYIFY